MNPPGAPVKPLAGTHRGTHNTHTQDIGAQGGVADFQTKNLDAVELGGMFGEREGGRIPFTPPCCLPSPSTSYLCQITPPPPPANIKLPPENKSSWVNDIPFK